MSTQRVQIDNTTQRVQIDKPGLSGYFDVTTLLIYLMAFLLQELYTLP